MEHVKQILMDLLEVLTISWKDYLCKGGIPNGAPGGTINNGAPVATGDETFEGIAEWILIASLDEIPKGTCKGNSVEISGCLIHSILNVIIITKEDTQLLFNDLFFFIPLTKIRCSSLNPKDVSASYFSYIFSFY